MRNSGEFVGGRTKPDVSENVLGEHGIHLHDYDLCFFQAIHQGSIVVLEPVDLARAMLGLAPSAAASIEMTDRALGIPRAGSQ